MHCPTCNTDFATSTCPQCGKAPPTGTGAGSLSAQIGSAGLNLSAGGFSTGMGASGVAGPAFALSAGAGATGAADAVATALKPGEVLADRYEIKDQLGAGGMGAVYRVHDRVRNVDVALKAMLPSLLLSPKAVERFRSEAEVSLQLSHEHIVRVFDVHHDPARGLRFYTMELLQGQSLRAWLHERKTKRLQVELADAYEIMAQLLEALRIAHRHTIHRDLKPENIFVLAGGKIRIKVVDFGIAKLAAGSGGAGAAMTVGGAAMGTAYYMAPEQQLDASGVDARADIYSASVVFYEMLTGKLPVGRFRLPSEERAGLPKALDALLLRGLDPDPGRRIAGAEDYLAALQAVRAGRPLPAPGGGTKRSPVGVLVLVLVLVLAAGGAWYAMNRKTGTPAVVSSTSTSPSTTTGTTTGTTPPTTTGTTTGTTAGATTTAGTGTKPSTATEIPASLGAATADTADPVITIEKPSAGFVTKLDKVEVSGTIEEPNLDEVLVQRTPASVREGRFSATVPIEGEGPTTVVVSARDRGGRKAIQTVMIERDTTLPEIEIESPAAAELGKPTKAAEVTVRGRVVDRSVAKVEAGDAAVIMEDAARGTFRVVWRLDDGPNTLRIVAADKAGNAKDVTLRATRDAKGPTISIKSDEQRSRANDDGDVVVEGSLDEPGCAVTVDDLPATVEGLSFKRTMRMTSPEKSFIVRATDPAGNTGQQGTPAYTFKPSLFKPGPAPGTVVYKKDGALMVKVEAGEFPLGSDFGDDDEKPQRRVHLDAFYVDVHEVTRRQFEAFARETGYKTDAEKAGAERTWRKPGFEQGEDHPVVFVSWNDATAYARWADKVLPTEAQWEKAASWDAKAQKKWPFAFGPDPLGPDRVLANIADRAAAQAKLLPLPAALKDYDDGHAATAPVGSFAAAASANGCLDMAGNVFEWCADWYSESAYKDGPARNPSGPERGDARVYRGGAWDSKLFLSVTARANNAPGEFTKALGFRCARRVAEE